MGSRSLKKKIGRLLAQPDVETALAEIRRMPPRQAVSPLFGYFCNIDETVKWHAVTAVGMLVADLAADDTESARVVIRRLMWNLNDESGGIGWGCPEAMGESLARSDILASEYWCVLTSYIQPEGNYLEHPILQRGAVWGVGRLAHSQPDLLVDCGALLQPYLEANDPILRATALWAALPLPTLELRAVLSELTEDHSQAQIYDGMNFSTERISDLAQQTLNAS